MCNTKENTHHLFYRPAFIVFNFWVVLLVESVNPSVVVGSRPTISTIYYQWVYTSEADDIVGFKHQFESDTIHKNNFQGCLPYRKLTPTQWVSIRVGRNTRLK